MVHVVSTNLAFPPEDGAQIIDILEKNARDAMRDLIRRKRLKPGQARSMVVLGFSAADVIAKLAKKSRASMIVLGSHGRTGFKRFMLGSVAERALRYAPCPVLIVKK